MSVNVFRDMDPRDRDELVARQLRKRAADGARYPSAPPAKPCGKAKARPPKKRKRSKGEAKMEADILRTGCPAPVVEYKPGLCLSKPRKHSFDFAWPNHTLLLPMYPDSQHAAGDFGFRRLAVEVDGGCHKTEQRLQSDVRKFNLYLPLGWLFFHYTTEMVMSGEAIEHLTPFLWSLH